MDYFYHYYNACDHHSTFSPVDQCYCPSSTFLLSVNIILLAILIYTFTMDKITITINPKSPFVSINDDSSSQSTTDPPSGSLELLKLPAKSKEPSKVTEPLTTTINSLSSPSDALFCAQEEKLINLESTSIFNEALVSPADSRNSFGSSSSIRRKLIKPDFSLSFFDSSMSSTTLPTDEDSRLKIKDDEDDSLRDFNVLIHTGAEEHSNHLESASNHL